MNNSYMPYSYGGYSMPTYQQRAYNPTIPQMQQMPTNPQMPMQQMPSELPIQDIKFVNSAQAEA